MNSPYAVKSSRVVLAVLAVLAMAVAECAVAQTSGTSYQPEVWNKVLAQAKKEGKVILYSVAAPTLHERIRADFKAAFPDINLEIGRYPGNGVVVKLEQERESNVAEGGDVGIVAEVPWAEERAKAGLLQIPSGPSSRGWPSKYLFGGAAPALYMEPFVIAYNANLVKFPVIGYQDLLRPEFKGQVNGTEPVSVVVVAFYDWLGKTQGGDFMTKFGAQNLRILSGGTVANTQSVGSGETLATVFTANSVVRPLVAQGAPIKVAMPKPALGFPLIGVLPAWSKRPNAALVLMDYLTSARAQTLLAGKDEAASALPGIPGAVDINNINIVDLSVYKPDVTKAYIAKWKEMFTTR